MSATTTHTDHQVLNFGLGEERYCVDISLVDEIVDRTAKLTVLPDAPLHVEGVMDLRGRTTTIVDPKKALGLSTTSEPQRIVIFEAGSDESPVGWLVDEVEQVVGILDEDVDASVASSSVHGIVRSDDGFVIWVDPVSINS